MKKTTENTTESLEANLFIGGGATGISYCDKSRKSNNDYKLIAHLSYATLELTVYDQKSNLLPLIKEEAAKLQTKKGESYNTSTCGQPITLGYQVL